MFVYQSIHVTTEKHVSVLYMTQRAGLLYYLSHWGKLVGLYVKYMTQRAGLLYYLSHWGKTGRPICKIQNNTTIQNNREEGLTVLS